MQTRLALRKLLVIASFFMLTNLLIHPCFAASQAVRIEVNTTELSLTVWAGNKAIKHYKHISIGSGGVSNVHYQGDQTTPVGEYTVLWINLDSPFDKFIGLNYPTRQHADIALPAGKLTLYEYRRISDATRHLQKPPFNTALGGRIGIHGIGLGDPRIHEAANWTNGCVALTNKEIKELLQWVHVGTKVTIHR